MKYYIFRLRWSQTDDEVVIVQAIDINAARGKILGNARYVDYMGSTEKLIS